MKSRKVAAIVAASLLWSTSAAVAQTGPNPAPETTPPAQPAPQADTMTNRDGGIFGSDLTFMLVAILAAAGLTFLAMQVGGDEEFPVSA
jgi:uncharacterized oligopeptide transporter (OPT) family protein